VTVASFGVPTQTERRHHFLWRFAPHLPGWGGMTVFDRSWYGRVLVERVDGLIADDAWRRAYVEINALERSLVDEGGVLAKVFLHLSEHEQHRRFEARRDDPLKSWKLTDDDWRAAAKRPAYTAAIEDMLSATDTTAAPWHVVPGDAKPLARVLVLRHVIERIEAGMTAVGIDPPPSRGLDYGT
jgi:polyphosphate kinase 2 (PPK2 family)